MKKAVSVLLIMFMLIQTVSFAAGDKIYNEDDTKQLVQKLSALGIFDEFDDEIFFRDNDGIKRSEAAVVISNMLGMEGATAGVPPKPKFFDVPQYCEYIHAVDYVTACGIMSEIEPGMFMPDMEMKIGHVLKCMVAALGYSWKAEAYGGYPEGYLQVASELKITKGLTKGINETATRADFLKFVDISLDKPICRVTGYSGDNVNFQIDEDANLLSEYHDIYTDKDVVQNNKVMSISKSAEPYDDIVFVGNKKLHVNGVTEIYSYFGCQVEFYYKKDENTDDNYLLLTLPTDENTINYILKDDFGKFSNNTISYYDKNGKERSLKLSSSAVIIHNGDIATNVAETINGYEGTLKTIDNNGDKLVDVIVVKNFTYDKVKNVKTEDQKIYTENKIIVLSDYENVRITDVITGRELEISDVVKGDVIGFAESTDKEKLMIEVIGTGTSIAVDSVSDDMFTTDLGVDYDISLLSAEQKALIKPGNTASLVAIDGFYAVWVDAASENVSLGYLISLREDIHFGKTILLGVKILETGGNVNSYKPADEEKIILNGKSVNASSLKRKLADIKTTYGLGGDGAVSQLISYKTNDDGNITNIYTLESGNNAKLYLKYGYKNQGKVQIYDDGYHTARFGLLGSRNYELNFSITTGHPIFKVPAEDQEGAPDTYYTSATYNEDEFEGKGESDAGWMLDSYVDSERAIIPKAIVTFMENADVQISDEDMTGKKGTLVLVDRVYQALDSQGEAKYVIKALSGNNTVQYYFDDDAGKTVESAKANAGNTEEAAGFTTGDVACIALNNINEVIKIHKVYDCETRTVNDIYKLYNGKSKDDTAAYTVNGVRTDLWVVEVWSAYNFSENGPMLETFEADLTYGIPGEEKIKLLDLYSRTRSNKKLLFYDEAQEKVYLGTAGDIIDYKQDPEKYTTIIVRHNNGWVWGNIVFYNYK